MFEFCLPTKAKIVPDGPDWLHEIKYDGYRLRVDRDGDRVRLITRAGYDWTKRYRGSSRQRASCASAGS
jgi:ATP-dependent DNA ligase